MITLEARGVTAGYGDAPVLHNVSIRLQQGEFVGLIGPNGCGKSTLLRCLSRTLPLRSGGVYLDGRPIESLSPRETARRIAVVPQQEAALFEFTVRDLVLMGRHPHIDRWRGEQPEDYEIGMRALADADIVHLADRPITTLSGGEHRRALLARALAQQTPLLLLDEPTAHLDVTHQVELLSLVQRRTREAGSGALAALHDLNEAAEFCDRLILMRGGRVAAEGAPREVLTMQNLRGVYNADARIGVNPATGRPMLLSVQPVRLGPTPSDAHRVHVVCGGGTGAPVIGALVRAGFDVTAGALNRLDTDQAAAEALGIPAALEAPFSPIGAAAREACATMMANVETIIVTPVPIGRGNLANLELTLEARRNGKRVILLGEEPFATLDHADGAGSTLLERLIAEGAVRFGCVEAWIETTAASRSGE